MSINVNYGCGLSAAHGWTNFDASPVLRVSKIPILGVIAKRKTPFPPNVKFGDITKKLPVQNGRADRVYCSHVLEHLSYDDFHRALSETFRIMKPGATFRGVMPDLEIEIRRYIDRDEYDAAHLFMKDTCLGVKSRAQGLKGRLMSSLGNSAHLWLWDYKALEKALLDAGFKNVRRAAFGDSGDQAFAAAESEARWVGNLGWNCEK